MPEFPLPPPPPLPAVLAPRPDGLAAVLAVGRARRTTRRRAAVACLAVAATFAFARQDGSSRGLDVVDVPPAPVATPATKGPAPAAVPPVQTATGGSATSTRAALAGTSGPVQETPSAGTPPSRTAAPLLPAATVTRTREVDSTPRTCDQDTEATRRGWCFRYLTGPDVPDGPRVEIAVEACRPLAEGALLFDSQAEIRIDVWRQAEGTGTPAVLLWSLAHGREPRPAYTVPVAAGYCARWTVSWNRVGDDGQLVPAGDYFVTAVVDIARSATEGSQDPQTRLTQHVLTIGAEGE